VVLSRRLRLVVHVVLAALSVLDIPAVRVVLVVQGSSLVELDKVLGVEVDNIYRTCSLVYWLFRH